MPNQNTDNNYKTRETTLGTNIKHPSYATIKFSRRQGSRGAALFGSSIHHNDTIACTISEASLTRALNKDWITSENTIIEVEMSYSQFAEAITSHNIGSGVPVTLRYLQGKGQIPDCDFVDKKDQFSQELQTKLNEANQKSQDLIQEVTKLFQKKSITVADKKEIIKQLQALNAAINDNIVFTFDQFNQQMDKTINEAKGEVEAFMQNKITQIANQSLIEQLEKKPQKLQSKNPIDL